MVKLLREDAAKPRAERRFLGDFDSPRVETFSFKSRDFSLLNEKAVEAQMLADAREALAYYGESKVS